MKNSKKIIDLSDRTNMFYWQTNRRITADEQKDIFLDRHRMVKKEEAKGAIEYGMKKSGYRKYKVKNLGDLIKHGSVNSVLKATLEDGLEVVVRMHPHGVKNGYFWSESIATKLAKKVGVPAYKTYFVDDTQEKFSFDFMIMEALPGDTMKDVVSENLALIPELTVQTGEITANIHKVKPQGFGFFKNSVAKSDGKLMGQYKLFKEHIFAALEEDLAFLIEHKVISYTQSKKLEKLFTGHEELMKIDNGSLVHNDIADWNELSDGKNVTGMVDWDECFSGDPVMDFSAYSLFYDEERLELFKKGYLTISKLPSGFEGKFHLYRVRYLISKMHLRKKRLLVTDSKFVKELLQRALVVMEKEFKFFGV